MQYPTVFVQQDFVIFCTNQETGESYEKTLGEMMEEDWDNWESEKMIQFALEDLRSQFTPYLKKGWIEIACCANEKCRYVMFESLRIHASGDPERMRAISGPCVDSSTFRESVSTSTSQAA